MALSSALFISCSRDQQMAAEIDELNSCNYTSGGRDETPTPPPSYLDGSQNNIPANISFCNTKVVPLCTKTISIGDVTVQKGSDGKVYITYNLFGSYYFKSMNLFTGAVSAIPISNKEANVCSFPFKKSFNSPANYVQKYTFVLNNQSTSFTIAAHASVVKKQGNSYKNDEDAWADGCDGQVIYNSSNNQYSNGAADGDDCKGGKWGTRFSFTGAICSPIAIAPDEPALPEPDICSQPIANFFGVHTFHGYVYPWIESQVTVGGFSYTETEGRAIAGSVDANNEMKDAKYVFLRIATLKLSYTGYTLSPTLAPAVTTIETWLGTVGKLSPSNLPNANTAVKNAAVLINTFIEANKCPDRIEE